MGSQQSSPVTFTYEKPVQARGKAVQILCRSDLLLAAVQAVGEGGETNLHAHASLDGFWFVLRGRATFYTTDDEVLGELNRHDGILIPRGVPYWFESSSDDDLEILQVEATAKRAESLEDFAQDRVDLTPARASFAQESARVLRLARHQEKKRQ